MPNRSRMGSPGQLNLPSTATAVRRFAPLADAAGGTPATSGRDGRLGAGVSAGIDMALYLVATPTDEETARRMQLDLEYEPEPPFGAINTARVPLLPRAFRGLTTFLAPLMTRRPKPLTATAGWN